MNEITTEKFSNLNIVLTDGKKELFNNFIKIFLEKNLKLNLISKNDEQFLFEKHIFDSLGITNFLSPKQGQTLLDIGTGGGFPAIPIAVYYENLEVFALDSIRKKINAVEEIKQELNLVNLHPICDRVENVNEQFDYVTSRAVSSLDKILEYAVPKLKKGGYFIAYKSKKANEELDAAQKTIKKSGIKVVKTITYTLPLDELFERNLIIFKKL